MSVVAKNVHVLKAHGLSTDVSDLDYRHCRSGPDPPAR